ncbi:MAG: transglutaminase-like domain-containing protein [Nibricoccus sp.]
MLKTTPTLVEKAREIVGAAATDDAKLKAIHEWCRIHITNLSRGTTHLTAEERKVLKKNENAAEILTAGKGSEADINLLFISLAMAAGFDARVAMCNNRFEFRYEENITEPALVFSDLIAAVQMGGDWRYFDPGSTYLSFGQLSSKNTDTALLVSDPNGLGRPTMIEGDPSNANCIQRKADLRLSPTGTIEGDVVETYSGQEDVNLKYFFEDQSPDKCAELFRKKILRQFKHARVTNVVVENAAGPSANLRVSYHLKIHAYAEKTGSRMFFQPAVFQKGGVKRLTLPDGERYNPLQFPHRFQTKDEIHIVLPSGYDMEPTTPPVGLDIDGLGDHDIEINLNRITKTVTYKREFNLSKIFFPTSVYPKMKDVLRKIRERDDHTLSLKRDETIDIPQSVESEDSSDELDSKTSLDDDDGDDMDFVS